MSSSPSLHIDSSTGVDVALSIAGPGGRSYAFVIDWHIRLVLALAWYAGAAVFYALRSDRPFSLATPLDPDALWALAVVAPSLAIYFLYHPLLEIMMRGSTPGKRMGGIRIVTQSGETPSAAALLIRNVFRVIDSFPLFYCVGLIATLVSAQHVRLGDLAAGTLLVYERRPELNLPAAAHRAALPLPLIEAAADLAARWPSLDRAARAELARRIVGRATANGGAVIEGDAALSAAVQQVARGERPR